MENIRFEVSPTVTDEALNTLFSAAWEGHSARAFQPILAQSLLYVCAYSADQLIGFVNLAWDGGVHAFLLDTTVHNFYGRRGIGTELVRRAVEAAQGHGIEWIHVDYEPHLRGFYEACGFSPTEAGLIDLTGA